MVEDDDTDPSRPFVATSIARTLISRLRATHEERAISVISGPWGIGKTTALRQFRAENPHNCAIVKVRPGAKGKQATAVAVIQLALEALLESTGRDNFRATHGITSFALRKLFYGYLDRHPIWQEMKEDARIAHTRPEPLQFTFIFDEAQHVSREAMETLRFWNDQDNPDGPFPVALFFVGNPELSLAEDYHGDSVISGAVRSRALFIENLEYEQVSDADLVLFLQSRGISDPGAIGAIVGHFSSARVRCDLRNVERLAAAFKRRAGAGAVTAEIVRSFLN